MPRTPQSIPPSDRTSIEPGRDLWERVRRLPACCSVQELPSLWPMRDCCWVCCRPCRHCPARCWRRRGYRSSLEQFPIGTLRHAAHDARGIGFPISVGLSGEPSACMAVGFCTLIVRSHAYLQIPPDEAMNAFGFSGLVRIEKRRGERRVCGTWRLPEAETRSDRAGLRHAA